MLTNITPNIRDFMTRKLRWFRQFGDVTQTRNGPLIFQDNGANVLAVAHLDTVGKGRFVAHAPFLHGITLDDRLGAYILLNHLKPNGMKCDILLTDGEESCRSTAAHFTPPRQYNWVFSLDRAGIDYVMYDYETSAGEESDLFISAMNKTGMELGAGTFSDICELTHLGCVGVNIGVGYHGQHTHGCFADLRETQLQLERLAEFYKAQCDTFYPWSPPKRIALPPMGRSRFSDTRYSSRNTQWEWSKRDDTRADWEREWEEHCRDATDSLLVDDKREFYCSECDFTWRASPDDLESMYCPICCGDGLLLT